VADVFAEEQSRLLSPALHSFPTDRIETVCSRKTIYVRFDLNDYSIPPEAVGFTNSSKTTLWNRLSQHRGAKGLRGNHRASVFRKLVGRALAARHSSLAIPTWGINESAPSQIRVDERPLEEEVSRYISAMPFLWLSVEDSPSPSSGRASIERNSIALLSNATQGINAGVDPPSTTWLGLECPHSDVRQSGLWNSRHVRGTYDPAFLNELDRLVG
jgi:hypothetical protein